MVKDLHFPRQYAAIFLVFLALDQWLKWYIRATFSEGEVRPFPWPGVFELKLAYNEGIAFGLAQGRGVLFAPVAIVIFIAVSVWAAKNKENKGKIQIPLGLISAGAVGNLIDRLWLGKVTDMFWFRPINFPVFNIADACLTVAVVMLFIHSLIFDGKNQEDKTLRPG